LVASGTSSKQLKRETDARPVGYGAMLLEGMVGVVSVCCLMMLPRITGITNPNYVYASGIGNFLRIIHIPVALGVSFGLLAFTTFVYDTLDVCTRLGRYILQELTGWQGTVGRWVATAATAMVPLYFVLQKATDAAGKPIPAWKRFWPLFGASNQLLAALTLLAITVWLYRTRRAWWVWPVVGVPSAFMYLMSMWALIGFVKAGFWKPLAELRQAPGDIVSWVALLLVGLSLMLLVEAARVLIRARRESVVPLAADAAS
jgi:carbon starvation protein